MLVSSLRGYSNSVQVRLKGRNGVPQMESQRAVVQPVMALSGQPSYQGLFQASNVRSMIDRPAKSDFGGSQASRSSGQPLWWCSLTRDVREAMGFTPEAFHSVEHGVFFLPLVHERNRSSITDLFPPKCRAIEKAYQSRSCKVALCCEACA